MLAQYVITLENPTADDMIIALRAQRFIEDVVFSPSDAQYAGDYALGGAAFFGGIFPGRFNARLGLWHRVYRWRRRGRRLLCSAVVTMITSMQESLRSLR